MKWTCMSAATFFLFVGHALAQDLGQVTDVRAGPEHCGSGAQSLAQPYVCYEATVECPLINPRLVNVRVTVPPDGTERWGCDRA